MLSFFLSFSAHFESWYESKTQNVKNDKVCANQYKWGNGSLLIKKKYCHTSNDEQGKDIFSVNLRGKCLMKLKVQLLFKYGLNWLNIFWKHPLEKKPLSNKNYIHSGKRFVSWCYREDLDNIENQESTQSVNVYLYKADLYVK